MGENTSRPERVLMPLCRHLTQLALVCGKGLRRRVVFSKRRYMQQSELHYLPLNPGYFSLLVGIFAVLLLLIQLGALRYPRDQRSIC